MPKIGAKPIRKAALINAAIKQVGKTGSLDVTVAQIAREAGMSPALAHHYFGSKNQIFLAAMRHILTIYRDEVRAALRQADTPQSRLEAVIHASFSRPNFDRHTIAAWLNFYVLALTEAEAARLLNVYRRRLRSNLMVGLVALAPERASDLAETLGALIDGVYLRAALPVHPATRSDAISDANAAERTVQDFLKDLLK